MRGIFPNRLRYTRSCLIPRPSSVILVENNANENKKTAAGGKSKMEYERLVQGFVNLIATKSSLGALICYINTDVLLPSTPWP